MSEVYPINVVYCQSEPDSLVHQAREGRTRCGQTVGDFWRPVSWDLMGRHGFPPCEQCFPGVRLPENQSSSR